MISIFVDISQIVIAVAAVIGIIYAYNQYNLLKKEKEEKERPFIFIQLERIVSGLFNIVIENIGTTPARDINITFEPNINYGKGDKKINDLKALKNLSFLGPGSKIYFYFGSVIGGNTEICREFKIKMVYHDFKNQKKWQEEQTINPTEYFDLQQIGLKDINDIGKNLEKMNKTIKAIYNQLKKK